MLENYERSVEFRWRRNPNYFLKELTPYLDGYNDHIIPQSPSQQAAFGSKQLDAYQPAAEQVLALFRDNVGSQLYRYPVGPNVHQLIFGSQPDSIFKDVRIRRAASMAIDRELMADVDTNAQSFVSAGIPYEVILDSHLTAAYKSSGLWLNPLEKEIGEGGAYFKHDITEAKKLLTAAGFANGAPTTVHFSSRGEKAKKEGEIAGQMLSEGGFTVKLNAADYQTVWLPVIYVATAETKGRYEGLGVGGSTSGLPDVLAFVYARLHSKGAFTGARVWDQDNAKTDQTIEKALQEFDDKKRTALLHDVQKQMALTQSTVSFGNGLHLFDLVWPWVQNWGFRASWQNSGSQNPHVKVWLDETKRT
jgi:ABC-type transport system substrate-binding protein